MLKWCTMKIYEVALGQVNGTLQRKYPVATFLIILVSLLVIYKNVINIFLVFIILVKTKKKWH